MADADDGYEVFVLEWSAFSIQVQYQRHWLNSGNWHIQLRCDAPLPVTQTGYRSIFVADAAFADANDIAGYVSALLDQAAQSKTWRAQVEDSKQLKLF